jgi:hypothetical protein
MSFYEKYIITPLLFMIASIVMAIFVMVKTLYQRYRDIHIVEPIQIQVNPLEESIHGNMEV